MTVPCRALLCPVVTAAFALTAFTAPALSQSASEPEAAAPQLALTLNNLSETGGDGCRLTFVIRNELGADIDALVAEAVLFDAEGRVASMTLFDFGTLPQGRPRVRQFDLAGQSCGAISEVLVNGLGTCEGESLSPATCLENLRLSTETDVEVTG